MKSKGKNPTKDQIRTILDTKEDTRTIALRTGLSQKVVNQVRHRGEAAVHYRTIQGRCPDCGAAITTKTCLLCEARASLKTSGLRWTEDGCVKK